MYNIDVIIFPSKLRTLKIFLVEPQNTTATMMSTALTNKLISLCLDIGREYQWVWRVSLLCGMHWMYACVRGKVIEKQIKCVLTSVVWLTLLACVQKIYGGAGNSYYHMSNGLILLERNGFELLTGKHTRWPHLCEYDYEYSNKCGVLPNKTIV